MANLKESTNPKINVRARDIFDRYPSTDSTTNGLISIGKIIRKLFPKVKITYPRNKQTGKQETAYQYIEFRGEEQAEIPTLTMENITNYIPKHCAVLSHTNDKVTFIVPTQFLCNGNILSKKVTIHNFEWNLSVREKDIELDSIGLDNIFDWTIDGMNKVLSIVDKLSICTGIPISDISHLDWDMNSNSCLEEYVSNIGDDNSGSKVIRYKHCKQILGWLSRVGSCIACQQTVRRNKRQRNSNEEENMILIEEDQADMSEILERVFPNDTADMKCLLESQRKEHCCKDRKGMKCNKPLKEKQMSFSGKKQNIILSLFNGVVSKYTQMSLNEFKGECRNFAAEKEQAHRKQMLKKMEKSFIQENWSMKNIYEDKSNRKISSHRYMQSQLETNSAFFTHSLFRRKDLINLCHAYHISPLKSTRKTDLAKKLQLSIVAASGMINHEIFSAVPSGSFTQETSQVAVTQDNDRQDRDMITRSNNGEESFDEPVEVDKTENTVDAGHSGDLADHIYCKAVSNLDAGSSSMWKGKRRRSSKSSSKEKRPMKRSKTIKSPCGICKQECTNGVVCCDYCDTWHHFDCLNVNADDEEFNADKWYCPECRKTPCADSD